jgi:hypothetical protein
MSTRYAVRTLTKIDDDGIEFGDLDGWTGLFLEERHRRRLTVGDTLRFRMPTTHEADAPTAMWVRKEGTWVRIFDKKREDKWQMF